MEETTSNNSIVRPYDILCGRSKNSFNNIGNRRFRITVGMNVKKYDALRSRTERGKFIVCLAHTLKHEVGFRFIRTKKGGEQIELAEEEIRAKIGHALRDLSASLREGAAPTTTTSSIVSTVASNIVTPTITKKEVFPDDSAQKQDFIAESTLPSLSEHDDHDDDLKIPAVVSSSSFYQEHETNTSSSSTTTASTSSFVGSQEPLQLFPLPCGDVPSEDDDILLQQQQEEEPMVDLLPFSDHHEMLPARAASMPMIEDDGSVVEEEDLHFFRKSHSFPNNYTQQQEEEEEEDNHKTSAMSIASRGEDDDYFLEKSLCGSVDCLSLDSH